MAVKSRSDMRVVRHKRIRKTIVGTSDKPRLAVFKSQKHLYAQVIDDTKSHTLASASTAEKALGANDNQEGAKKLGLELGKRAKEAGVKTVVFDRGGFRYHGCLASLADGAREAGLEF